jgi:ubiquinone biosynthesis protein UbiJ
VPVLPDGNRACGTGARGHRPKGRPGDDRGGTATPPTSRIVAAPPKPSRPVPGGRPWWNAYNRAMLEAVTSLLRSAVTPRLLLLLNHVVAAEPAATERLRPHAGARLTVELADLPAPAAVLAGGAPPVVLRVTPAGLFESVDAADADGPAVAGGTALHVRIDASNPLLSALKAAAGERPTVRIDGDAAFAADVSWLFDNLRWDVQDDLERLVGPVAAGQLGSLGRAVGSALKALASRVADAVGTVPGMPGPRHPEGAADGPGRPTAR